MLFACAVLLAAANGCEKPNHGPKRADDVAAHTTRYHPDIHRQNHDAATGGSTAAATSPADTAATAPAAKAGPLGCPVLFVNTDTITVQEVLEPILDELQEKAKTLSPSLYAAAMRSAIQKQIDTQISILLIYEEAKDTYPSKATEFFEKEADRRIKEAINLRFDGIHARYEAHLKALGLTVEDIKNRVKRQVMFEQYMRDKFQPSLREPPRRQLLKYYETHLDQFTKPARAELFLIEVPIAAELKMSIKQATSEDLAAARKRAIAHLKRAQEELAAGVEFEAVAKAYSKGVKAAVGGAWGEISPNTMQGRWAKAAEVLFTLKPGESSDIIETDDAVFIVKCGQSTPAQQVSFEEAQKTIIDRMKEEQFDRVSREHIQKLYDKAIIGPMIEFAQAVQAATPRPAPSLPPPAAAAQ